MPPKPGHRHPMRAVLATSRISLALLVAPVYLPGAVLPERPVMAQSVVGEVGEEFDSELWKMAEEFWVAQDWDNAAKAYTQLTDQDPTDGVAWFRLGYALHAAGQLEEAIRAHRRAATFPELHEVSLYNLACAYSLDGQTEQAFETLDKLVKAAPKWLDRDDLRADADLDNVRSDPRFEELLDRVKGRVPPPRTRQFDFWIGEWDVYDRKGNKVGTNIITLRQNGNIVHEAWTNTQGNTGESMNFYDPDLGRWRQIWVDGGGGVVEYQGVWHDGAMRLTEGRRATPAGSMVLARATFTPLESGFVRQFLEESADEGQTWTVYFDGLYVPRGSESPGVWDESIMGQTATVPEGAE